MSLPRIAYKIGEVAEMCGVSEITIRRAIDRGLLKPCRAFRHPLIPADQLDKLLGQLEDKPKKQQLTPTQLAERNKIHEARKYKKIQARRASDPEYAAKLKERGRIRERKKVAAKNFVELSSATQNIHQISKSHDTLPRI